MRGEHVVVVGAMGAGKSTIGRLLAARLARPFRDSDEDLVSEQGVSGREVAARDGVDALHRWEAHHLLRALAGDSPVVVAPAASVVDDARCRAALAGSVVIWLDVPRSVLERRLAGTDADHRRPVGPAGGALATGRADAFRSVADIVVEVGERPAGEVIAEVVARLSPSAL